MKKPVVGVTKPNSGGLIQNWAIRLSLWMAGAKGINISPSHPAPKQSIDGLVISGGTDIFPGLFNNEEVKPNYKYDSKRDALEIKWLQSAKLSKIPVFCICRGAQLLNVYEGGTLFTNIKRVFENAEYPTSLLAKIFFRKKIFIEEESKLFDAFQTTETEVNSMHSQSIDEVGDDLKVTSTEKNGIVQSVEHRERDYIVGVQFHPEFLTYREDARRLFSDFVTQCQNRKANHDSKSA